MQETTRPDAFLFIRHATNLCLMARGFVSYQMIQAVINSAPCSEAERQCEGWRESSLCWQLLLEVHEIRKLYPWAQKEYDAAAAFWLEEYPIMPLAARLGGVHFINHSADFFASGKYESIHPKAVPYLHAPTAEACKVLAFPNRHV